MKNVFICGYQCTIRAPIQHDRKCDTDKRNRLTSEHADQLIFLFALKITIKLSKAVHAWTSPVCFYARCITQIYTLYSYHGMLGLNVIRVPFLTIIVIS